MSIDNLEQKLNGELPVTREELIELINSWGRRLGFYTKDSQNKDIYIGSCEAKECYDLSKLDTSRITNMDSIFKHSLFNDIHPTNGIGLHNGDISSWNMSNVTNMSGMFSCAENFNQDIGNWDVSNVTSMNSMFSNANSFNQPLNFDTSNVTSMNSMFGFAKSFNQPLNFDTSNVTDMYGMFYEVENFNQDISNWNVSNVTSMKTMFYNAKAFQNKYNSGEPLPNYTNEIKKWLNENREKMNMIDVKDKHGNEIDDFFSNITDIYSTNRIGLHENLLTECNK